MRIAECGLECRLPAAKQPAEIALKSSINNRQSNPQPAFRNPDRRMFILDTLLIGSLRFVLDKVVAAAEAEMEDDTVLRDRLLEAQMQLELGEISDEEFAEIEQEVLAAIRDIKGRQQGAISMGPADNVSGVEIESWGDK